MTVRGFILLCRMVELNVDVRLELFVGTNLSASRNGEWLFVVDTSDVPRPALVVQPNRNERSIRRNSWRRKKTLRKLN